MIQRDGSLVEMSETPYASEAMLQELLARYPSLLAGNLIDPEAPRNWLLVSREQGLAAEEDGSRRWSVDHLFLDQDAIPTLVEVKRSSDTRIRREVVGQMLDYAANAVVYLPVEEIRSRFEASCRARGEEPDALLESFLRPGRDPMTFWQGVKTNLQAGRVRLLFVADVIPPELQRIVEFLNQQMDPAEVLAVEIRHYAAADLKTLVPRVFGQTAEAQRKKATGRAGGERWDEETFFENLTSRKGPDAAVVARRILEWGKSKTTRIDWGSGTRDGCFIPVLIGPDGRTHYPFAVYSSGRLDVQFYCLNPPFKAPEVKNELLELLNKVPGVSILPSQRDGRPAIQLAALSSGAAWAAFQCVLDWYARRVSAG